MSIYGVVALAPFSNTITLTQASSSPSPALPQTLAPSDNDRMTNQIKNEI